MELTCLYRIHNAYCHVLQMYYRNHREADQPKTLCENNKKLLPSLSTQLKRAAKRAHSTAHTRMEVITKTEGLKYQKNIKTLEEHRQHNAHFLKVIIIKQEFQPKSIYILSVQDLSKYFGYFIYDSKIPLCPRLVRNHSIRKMEIIKQNF